MIANQRKLRMGARIVPKNALLTRTSGGPLLTSACFGVPRNLISSQPSILTKRTTLLTSACFGVPRNPLKTSARSLTSDICVLWRASKHTPSAISSAASDICVLWRASKLHCLRACSEQLLTSACFGVPRNCRSQPSSCKPLLTSACFGVPRNYAQMVSRREKTERVNDFETVGF